MSRADDDTRCAASVRDTSFTAASGKQSTAAACKGAICEWQLTNKQEFQTNVLPGATNPALKQFAELSSHHHTWKI